MLLSIRITKKKKNYKRSLSNGLYYLHPKCLSLYDTEIIEPNHKRLRLFINETYLWHLRLGHINLDRIKKLVRHGLLNHLKVHDLPTSESCLEGKCPRGFSN